MSATTALVRLLGCEWGVAVFSHHDTARCWAQAVERIAIHGAGDGPTLVQLCARHGEIVMAETDPRSAR
jgi:hypothetical protein